MDAFVEAGGNFIDTADVYSRWVEGNSGGVAEEIIGRWIKQRSNRRNLVIATKVRGRMWEGGSGEGLSRQHIMLAVEDSLRRLQTDYIDLYQSHWYDRETPIEETMRAFDDLVKQGKVLYVGCSNYPAWRVARALWASDVNGWVRFDSLQPHYNLVHRAEYERDLQELCAEQGIGVLPYSPLQGGFLTGKYRRGQALPETPRASRIRESYLLERNLDLIEVLVEIAEQVGATVAQLSLAWLLSNLTVTAPIIGANSVEQLRELLPAVDVELAAPALTC
jgi:aryl-alcohol dehydrogenase-like predicted oxidoreductase